MFFIKRLSQARSGIGQDSWFEVECDNMKCLVVETLSPGVEFGWVLTTLICSFKQIEGEEEWKGDSLCC